METGARCVCSLHNQFLINTANDDDNDDNDDDGDDGDNFFLPILIKTNISDNGLKNLFQVMVMVVAMTS